MNIRSIRTLSWQLSPEARGLFADDGGASAGGGGGGGGAGGGGATGGEGGAGGGATGGQGASADGKPAGGGSGDKGGEASGDKGGGAGDGGKPADKTGATSILGGAPDPATKGGEGEKGGGDKGKPSEIEIKLPEGTKVDAATLEGFKGVAKKVGLDSAKATEIAAWYAGEQRKTAETWAKGETPIQQGWKAEIAKDPDFGGDKLAATTLAARNAVERFGGAAARQAFEETGIGNHPALVRMLARIGQAIGEADGGGGGSRNSGELSPEERLARFYKNSRADQQS